VKRFLLAFLLLPAVARAQAGIAWTKNIDEAKKAAAEKKPIAVVLMQKGCPLSGGSPRTDWQG